MEQSGIAVGLDIGTTKIVAMVGRMNEYGKLEVLGMGKSRSLGVQRGIVSNITETIKSIQEAVKEAEATSGMDISDVVVGIAGQHIRSLQHRDYITREDSEEVIDDNDINQLINNVHKLVMLPGEEIIHVLPQDYRVDGEANITEPRGMYGMRFEANFHIVVGQITAIKNIGRCVKNSGLEVADITLEPLASAEAVLSEEEKEAGVCLVDIGGGTTDVAIFKNKIIRHTAVIPFGGNVITEDIKEGCSIIEKHAELLKVKFGSAWPNENKDSEIVSIPGLRGREPKEISLKNLSKIIHARVQEIIEQVNLEVQAYGAEDPKKKLIAGIVLTGGGSKLKHIKQLVEYITGMDTRIGYPNEHLASETDQELSSPMYATSVGLVMKGLEAKTAIQPEQRRALDGVKDVQDEVEKGMEHEAQMSERASETTVEEAGSEDPVKQEAKTRSVFDRWAEKFKDYLSNED